MKIIDLAPDVYYSLWDQTSTLMKNEVDTDRLNMDFLKHFSLLRTLMIEIENGIIESCKTKMKSCK